MADQRRQFIYMELWALDALYIHMKKQGIALSDLPSIDERRMLGLPNSNVVLVEWNPDTDSKQLSITAPDNGMSPRVAAEQPKEYIEFEYVFCIGGDGTLLRLLRILFFRFLPVALPKIITVSMGSLGYLCNFKIRDFVSILDSTVLANQSELNQR